MSEILAFGNRRSNAELIRDAHALGYINGKTLDMTYGSGRFWKLYRPERLTTNDIAYDDLDPDSAQCGYDFTDLPDFWTDRFDTVVFDPPYKLNGTGGSHPSDAGYGVDNSGKGRIALILGGFEEGYRVTAPGGHFLVKCQDQVVSGHKVWMTMHLGILGGTVNFRLVDQLHVRSYRPQPPGRRQVHSRQDYSTLLVFKKGKK